MLAAVAASSIVFPAVAGKPQALNARIVELGDKSSYHFEVTVAHIGSSWDHYLDRWEVICPGGKVLGARVLFHPHLGEESFFRTLHGVIIPEGVKHVIIRVYDKTHGYGREKLMTLPTNKKRETGVQ